MITYVGRHAGEGSRVQPAAHQDARRLALIQSQPYRLTKSVGKFHQHFIPPSRAADMPDAWPPVSGDRQTLAVRPKTMASGKLFDIGVKGGEGIVERLEKKGDDHPLIQGASDPRQRSKLAHARAECQPAIPDGEVTWPQSKRIDGREQNTGLHVP